MSKLPKMPFFVDAYMADTQHLTLEEHGAYLLLLFNMWRRDGTIPDDDRDNARILGITSNKWRKIKERLRPLLLFYGPPDSRVISQKRLQDEWNKCVDYQNKQRERGQKGGNARWSEENQSLRSSLGHSRGPSAGDGTGNSAGDGRIDGRTHGREIASQSQTKEKSLTEEQVEGQGSEQADEPEQAQPPAGGLDGPPATARADVGRGNAPVSPLLQTSLMRKTENIGPDDIPDTKPFKHGKTMGVAR